MPLWVRRQLATVVVINLLGAVLVAIGWYGSSGERTVGKELAWFNLGIAGLIILGAANAYHVLWGRRSVAAERRAMVARLPLSPLEPRQSSNLEPVSRAANFVAAAGMRYFHLVGCPLAAGKAVRAGTAADFAHTGLDSCEVCRPCTN
jgi:hypothetical protein